MSFEPVFLVTSPAGLRWWFNTIFDTNARYSPITKADLVIRTDEENNKVYTSELVLESEKKFM